MKRKSMLLLGDLGRMFRGRAFYGALIFSLSLHTALFLLWKDWPRQRPKTEPFIMVARLVRGSSADPLPSSSREKEAAGEVQEKRAEEGAEEDVPGEAGESSTLPPSDGTGSSLQVGIPVLSAGLAPSAGARGALAAMNSPALDAAAGRTLPAATAGRFFSAVIETNPGKSDPHGKGDVTIVLAEIRRRIESKKTYPLLARKNGWEGSVLVEIELGGAGELEGVRLLHESGFPILDHATLAAVRKAVPFPPLPGKVRVPVCYRLDRN